MKILHTSDWHLGKMLGRYSRIEEQSIFIKELTQLVDKEHIDMVLVAGDIFDNGNPPAAAEKLFFDCIYSLSGHGKRPVVIVGGNHDSPERLMAASTLSSLQGILTIGAPTDVVKIGKYAGFEVVNAVPGCFELRIKNETAILITLPYPSEKRIGSLLFGDTLLDENQMQPVYADKIKSIMDKLAWYFRADTINIVVGHFFVSGSIEAGSERQIQLGGSYAVPGTAFPKADYIAMGHIHNPQKLAGIGSAQGYYSGSPLQYSKSEAGSAKCVYTAQLKAGEPAIVKRLYLSNPKPIELFCAGSTEEALAFCKANSATSSYVFLEIRTDAPIPPSELKKMKALKENIVEITPVFLEKQEQEATALDERSISEQFSAFYKSKYGAAPDNGLMTLFLDIMNEDEPDETTTA